MTVTLKIQKFFYMILIQVPLIQNFVWFLKLIYYKRIRYEQFFKPIMSNLEKFEKFKKSNWQNSVSNFFFVLGGNISSVLGTDTYFTVRFLVLDKQLDNSKFSNFLFSVLVFPGLKMLSWLY